VRFIPSWWLHRPQENRLPGSLCDETPESRLMVADGPIPMPPTVSAKWSAMSSAEHAAQWNRPEGEDDMPPMLLLARMRQRLDFVRQALREVTNDRAALEAANDRLIEQRNAAQQEAEALRTALAHVGGELETARARADALTVQLAGCLSPGDTRPLRRADDELLVRPLPGRD
jgi:hypothetical protein